MDLLYINKFRNPNVSLFNKKKNAGEEGVCLSDANITSDFWRLLSLLSTFTDLSNSPWVEFIVWKWEKLFGHISVSDSHTYKVWNQALPRRFSTCFIIKIMFVVSESWSKTVQMHIFNVPDLHISCTMQPVSLQELLESSGPALKEQLPFLEHKPQQKEEKLKIQGCIQLQDQQTTSVIKRKSNGR